MRLKKELYNNQQSEIVDKLINILQLDKNNTTTLYELDTNINKQEEIIKLIPEIKKYFSYACMKGVREPEKVKRSYLSIIRHITKLKYDMLICDLRTTVNNNEIRTKKYIFNKKNI